jgi:hypothetical protein
MDMLKKLAWSIIIFTALFVQSCGILSFKEAVAEDYSLQEEQYQPYTLQHTIAGYKEFIARYPENRFVKDAQAQIEDLEFAPYEKANTIEGYMEFAARYPRNRHCSQCDMKIEQLECKRCEELETIDGYKEFLLKYPDSSSAALVKKKLAALEILEQQGRVEKSPPAQELSIPSGEIDGSKVMTMMSTRDRGMDYILSTSWILTKNGRKKHSTKYMEKRKNLGGRDGLLYKSVVRYIDPADYYGTAILTWNYRDGKRSYWTLRFRRRPQVAKRDTNPELLRPPAEADFNLADYYDINLAEENHKFLRSEVYDDTRCFVVESIPIFKNARYGKRIIWITHQDFIPLKIEYYNQTGDLWKNLLITWQKKYGLWFWEKAEVTNLVKAYKTFITIEDVRVNIGLPDRDFTRNSLETKILGF